MKLLELEIHNVRGISDLYLKPDGKTLVIWGPNGSGKSSVVDAIDFLLTGRISRLAGRGTGGISLKNHGPHIDRTPEEASVRAILQIPGLKTPVEVKRCIAEPNSLESDPAVASHLRQIELLASRGQHVLTRREILKFITAEGGTRASQIQELLNISAVERIRTGLRKTQNDLKRVYQTSKKFRDEVRGQVNATIGKTTFSEVAILEFVNQNRAILNGSSLTTLDANDLKVGLAPPTTSAPLPKINRAILDKDIQNLHQLLSPAVQTRLAQADQALRSAVTTIRANPELLRSLSRQQLLELGLELLDETGSCPLCDTSWPPGKLETYLNRQIANAHTAKQYHEQIVNTSTLILDLVNNAIAILRNIVNTAQSAEFKENMTLLRRWRTDLQALAHTLNEPLERYPDPQFDPNQVKQLLAPSNFNQSISQIQAHAKDTFPEASPEQTAWDNLTRLEENLKNLHQATENSHHATQAYHRADILLNSFVKARDKVLGDIYDAIRDRFVELYQQLHSPEEDNFTANITPDGASLNLEVDFYGRGVHPPHALHSEGHQDSMGICLYLALAERLNQNYIDLVILDDVIMSIDADHRRKICSLLATTFPEKQFIITTHDRTWATQLRSEGVSTSKSTVELYRWHLQTGPQVNYEVDLWEKIANDLEKNDIPAAAGRLRRGSEQFFEMVSDSLQVFVRYRSNGRWELGDFLSASMGQYKKLLKEARKSANSWEDEEVVERIRIMESTAATIFSRTQAEQWGVNASVHYNYWANLQQADFQPIVEAFQDLYTLFLCSHCGGVLRLVTAGVQKQAVRCNCGKVNWNMVPK